MSQLFTCNRELPYSPEQMFDLVADIERYPEFLDGWKRARIIRSEGDVALVDQEMSLAGMTLPLTTRAEFRRPHALSIASEAGPIAGLDIRWAFAPETSGGCRVDFAISYANTSAALSFILSIAFRKMGPDIVSAFERRARKLYGG